MNFRDTLEPHINSICEKTAHCLQNKIPAYQKMPYGAVVAYAREILEGFLETLQDNNSPHLTRLMQDCVKTHFEAGCRAADMQNIFFWMREPLSEALRVTFPAKELRTQEKLINDLLCQCASKITEIAISMNHQLQCETMTMMIHDLRSPLTAVLCNLELVYDENKNRMAYADLESLDEAMASCQMIRKNVEFVVDMLQLESGKIPIDLQTCLLHPMTGRLCTSFRQWAKRSGKELQILIPPELKVQADPKLLRRILENLLANAIEHTEENAVVEIAARALAGSLVEISVTRKLILRPIEKIPAGKSRTLQHAKQRISKGLGLTFCEIALKMMSGKINTQPLFEGKGWVAFTLPG